jgi:hypothetical protein
MGIGYRWLGLWSRRGWFCTLNNWLKIKGDADALGPLTCPYNPPCPILAWIERIEKIDSLDSIREKGYNYIWAIKKESEEKRGKVMFHGIVDMPCPREPSTRHFLAWVLLEITETQKSHWHCQRRWRRSDIEQRGINLWLTRFFQARAAYKLLTSSSHGSHKAKPKPSFAPARPTRTGIALRGECFGSTSHKARIINISTEHQY